ncbi:MAG: hypothetical protein RBT80_12200 [Candidatus Vecturithrix sp.]|jgi:hypothetical protein|nr:hypothetical protein [Candidatus Vecturithrix sp.]
MTLDEKISTLQTNNQTEDPHYATLLAMQKDGARNLPFLVIAMTRPEAQELLSEKADVFDNTVNEDIKAKQARRFRQFKRAFNQVFPTDANKNAWLAHYNEHSRADWIPHLYPSLAAYGIAALLEEESLSRYQRLRSVNMPVKKARDFWPDVIRQETLFARERDVRDAAWRALPLFCILVIDGFSLFHPVIRSALESSALNSWENPGAALLLAAPEQPKSADSLDTLLETELKEEIGKAFARFNQDCDPFYAFELTTERRLKRWLHVSAAGLIAQQPAADLENLRQVEAQRHGQGAVLMRGGLA